MSRTRQDALDKLFVDVGSVLDDVLAGVLPDWQRVGSGGERHGAREWVVHRRTEDLDRYVVLAVVPRDAPYGDAVFHVEGWVGAQRGSFSRRVLLGEGEAVTVLDVGPLARDLLADAEQRATALAEEVLRATSALR